MANPETPLGWAALGVRFALEVAALAALAYWGWRIGAGPARYVLAVCAPLVAAVVWGAVVAPKAPLDAPRVLRLLVSLAVFGAAVLALAVAGRETLAAAYAVVALADTALVYALGLD